MHIFSRQLQPEPGGTCRRPAFILISFIQKKERGGLGSPRTIVKRAGMSEKRIPLKRQGVCTCLFLRHQAWAVHHNHLNIEIENFALHISTKLFIVNNIEIKLTQKKWTDRMNTKHTTPVSGHEQAQPSPDMNKNRPDGKNWKKQARIVKSLVIASAAFAVLLSALIMLRLYQHRQEERQDRQESGEAAQKIPRPELDVELLTVNAYSRPAAALKQVRGVVIHYTANPGTGAMANRNYFEGLKDSHVTKASSHFIIGLDGEIVQCIPSSEIAYASNERNADTVSIECCIEDDTGRFNAKTYDAAVHLTAWLVEHFGLETKDVIRHYDVTGKACPKYFVEFPSAWEQFLADVQEYLEFYGVF